jgi:hypothetical protein
VSQQQPQGRLVENLKKPESEIKLNDKGGPPVDKEKHENVFTLTKGSGVKDSGGSEVIIQTEITLTHPKNSLTKSNLLPNTTKGWDYYQKRNGFYSQLKIKTNLK